MAVTQQLISALFDRWVGQPILVLGGGPSVLTDLPKLADIKPACVISANEHGARQKVFPVDLVVNMDNNHCLKKIPMESLLRPLGIPIVNRFSWSDYRLCDWPLRFNTGIAAVAVAAALGGNPVIVTGIDLWGGGGWRYFHTPPGKQRRPAKIHPAILRRANKQRIIKLADFCKGANIRPMSGPLLEVFRRYKPGEVLPETRPIRYRREVEKLTPVIVEAVTRFRFTGIDMVKPGSRIVLSPKEAATAPYGSRCRRLAKAP